MAGVQAVQPMQPQAPGLAFQVVGQAHGPMEPPAEAGHRLHPTIGRDPEPIEDRAQDRRDRPARPGPELPAGRNLSAKPSLARVVA